MRDLSLKCQVNSPSVNRVLANRPWAHSTFEVGESSNNKQSSQDENLPLIAWCRAITDDEQEAMNELVHIASEAGIDSETTEQSHGELITVVVQVANSNNVVEVRHEEGENTNPSSYWPSKGPALGSEGFTVHDSNSNHLEEQQLEINKSKVLIAVAYGPAKSHERHFLWDFLNTNDFPWLIVGDFNQILRKSKKVSRCDSSKGDKQFAQMMTNTGLIELPSKGNQFTGTNNRTWEDAVWEKLDRALCNANRINH
ncbi:reverse transcriptase [Senna tora]|uniref:Reverse transcriptase n=1 Tax=Senna tora TaxID=362788 RepID=A0A834XD76_9FABA|nr:reverse transcriptase [Senna tora]